MKVNRVGFEEFETGLKGLNPLHAFNRPLFALLNNLWVDEIHFLLVTKVGVEFAAVFGERNGVLLSPWSAPFGGFAFKREDVPLEELNELIDAIGEYAERVACKTIEITFPPSFYANNFLSKIDFLFLNRGVKSITEINYHFDLQFHNNSTSRNRNFVRNFNKGDGMLLSLCSTNQEKEIAYTLIEINRTVLGYPLRMGFEQLLATSKIIDVDFFVLKRDDINYASAICYHVTSDIVQIIYWGDDPAHRGSGAMQQLSVQLQHHYQNKGKKYLDIGPSSEKGLANYGLCQFKEMIGGVISLKKSYTFQSDEHTS